MATFQVFSDGAADIPLDMAKENNINIIPFYISLDGKSYKKELFELSHEEYYKPFVEQNLFPKTSLPPVQDYIETFTPALEKGLDVLCFNITLTLSGSYQSALTAASILEEKFPERKIKICNSWLATGAQQLLTLEAAKMCAAGYSVEETFNKCEQLKEDARIIFMVGGLDHLQKGGRIGKVGAAAGGILKIKPLIILKGGEISLCGVTRSRKSGIKKLSELVKNHFQQAGENINDYCFTVGQTYKTDEIPIFKDELKKLMPEISFNTDFKIGATISAHTGPETLGVCFIKKYDK